jgi:hypothetical protein
MDDRPSLSELLANIPRGPVGPDDTPDFEKLADARKYCAQAMFKHLSCEPNEALYQLICAVDHMIAAWQQ